MFNPNLPVTLSDASCSTAAVSHLPNKDFPMRIFFTLALLITLFGCLDQTHADWFYDFEDNRVPESWVLWTHPSTNSNSNTYSVDASHGYLQIAESRSLNGGGTPVLRTVDKSETFHDVRLSASINLDPSVGTLMGLTTDTETNGGYLFGVEFAPSADVGTAWFVRPGGGRFDDWNSKRDFGIPTRLEIDDSYFLQLDVIGDQLTGRVFDTQGGNLLLSMTQTVAHPIVVPKYAGVYSATPNGFEHIPTAGTFDDIRATTLRPGDANLDGEVNFADFLTLSEHFGEGSSHDRRGWDEGDFDGNGEVDFPDFLILSENFGAVAAANPSAAAVPEPTAVSLAFFGLLGLIGFRKRR